MMERDASPRDVSKYRKESGVGRRGFLSRLIGAAGALAGLAGLRLGGFGADCSRASLRSEARRHEALPESMRRPESSPLDRADLEGPHGLAG
jgi:hypothetical protein